MKTKTDDLVCVGEVLETRGPKPPNAGTSNITLWTPTSVYSVCSVDGSSQDVRFPLYEWTRATGPIAFDLQNTAGFRHAAVVHQIVKVARSTRKIVGISSHSGTYGPIAVTLESGRSD